jgi:Flp pilus assembly protein TadD/TolB-like protein
VIPLAPERRMIGRTLDSFRIVAPLGRGGMGEVWKAEQLTLANRLVALKLLRADRALGEHALERIQREAATVARLHHTGIAQVHQAGTADGLYYLAMELVEGESLTARLEQGPLAAPEARRVVLAVADALGCAHDAGVLHRDVTTNNIMLEPSGRVVLLDFGLALVHEHSRLTSDGLIVGTTEYIAPEVLRGFEPDARSDVYSLGVVLYRALTGAFPFRGERREQLIRAALDDVPLPPSHACPGLPPDWDALVLRAIAREPGLRYASMRELAQELGALEEPPATPPARESSDTESKGTPERAPSGGTHRIAVMPFTDLGGTSDGAAFADGLADAAGVALARHPGLQVVPPIATRELAREGLRRVARELGAGFVLTGTVRRSSDRLELTVSLVDARTAQPVMAETFEGSLGNLREMEAELVRAVADALRLGPPPVRSRAGSGPDPVSDEHHLQARGYLQHFSDEAAVDGAIRLLEPLANRDGATADTWASLAQAYRYKYRITLERHWVERAQRAAAKARTLDPRSAHALSESGWLHALLGRPQEAERELREAMGLRPALLSPRIALTEVLQAQGRLAEAEAECRGAIAIQPDAWNSYNRLGAIHFEQGRFEDAIAAFEHVVRLKPDDARARTNIGASCFRLGRLKEAERAYRAGLDLQRSPRALTGLGVVLYHLGDLPAAVEAFERAAGLKENDPVMWGNLGLVLRQLPDGADRAHAALTRAIELVRDHLAIHPRDLDAHGNLAIWLASSGALVEARERIGRALEQEPAHVRNLTHAVTIHELSGDRAAALEAMERALAARAEWMEFEHDPALAALRASERYLELKTRWTSGAGAGAAAPVGKERPEEVA